MNNVVLRQIQERLHLLRPSEKKVAEMVMSHPATVSGMRLAAVAEFAKVSEPTVVRFCRTLGYTGFQDFRVSLAAVFIAEENFEKRNIKEGDSFPELIDKVFDAAISGLLEVREHLNATIVSTAVEAIANGKAINIYAFGGSASLAYDLQYKLLRLHINSAVFTDTHIQRMSAVSLTKGDIVIAISHSGNTKALVDTLKYAINGKDGDDIRIITIAPKDSPISELGSIAIKVQTDRNDLPLMPASSRLAFIAVLDTLIMGVAQQNEEAAQAALKRVLASQRNLRVNTKGKH